MIMNFQKENKSVSKHIRITKAQDDYINNMIEQNDTTFSDIVRQALDLYFQNN